MAKSIYEAFQNVKNVYNLHYGKIAAMLSTTYGFCPTGSILNLHNNVVNVGLADNTRSNVAFLLKIISRRKSQPDSDAFWPISFEAVIFFFIAVIYCLEITATIRKVTDVRDWHARA